MRNLTIDGPDSLAIPHPDTIRPHDVICLSRERASETPDIALLTLAFPAIFFFVMISLTALFLWHISR